MRRNDRRAVVEAKHMLPPPDADDCCEHGVPYEEHCQACDEEVMDWLRSEEPAQERRAQGHADQA